MIPDKKEEPPDNNNPAHIRELIDSNYQGVKRLFVLAYDDTDDDGVDSHKKYFLPRVNIEKYNIEIDERNFYDPLIHDSIEKYDEVSKIQQEKEMITQQVVC